MCRVSEFQKQNVLRHKFWLKSEKKSYKYKFLSHVRIINQTLTHKVWKNKMVPKEHSSKIKRSSKKNKNTL